MLVLGDVERARIPHRGRLEQALELIADAQLVVGEREGGLRRQPGGGEIACARLGILRGVLDRTADAAPDIDGPARAGIEVELVGGIHPARGRPLHAAMAGTLRARPDGRGRGKAGTRGIEQRHRLAVGRLGILEVLIGDVDLLLQAIQDIIMEERPPRSTLLLVLGLADLPALELLEGLRRFDRCADVIRSYRAASHGQPGCQAGDHSPACYVHEAAPGQRPGAIRFPHTFPANRCARLE